MRRVSVAVPVPGIGPLTYAIPDGQPDPSVGARVLVPLGKRLVTGVALPIRDSSTSELDPLTSDVKPIADVLDPQPFLPPEIVALATWVADYYACGIGDAISTTLPPRAWVESDRHARITDAGEARLLTERGTRREVLEFLSGGRVASIGSLVKKSAGARPAVAALQDE